MARLTIPERYRAGVSRIRQLDDNTVREIRAALDRVLQVGVLNPPITSTRLNEAATEAIVSVTRESASDFKRIAQALVELYTVRSVREIPIEQFADEVSDALERLDEVDLRLAPEERQQFKQNIITLLSAEVFGVVAKAWDLKTDDERTFCHARILTDLRPVFGANVEDGPKAMVLVHLLKLAYHTAEEKHHKEFFVSLDADDLQSLRELIERAEMKADALKDTIKDLRIFGVSRESKSDAE